MMTQNELKQAQEILAKLKKALPSAESYTVEKRHGQLVLCGNSIEAQTGTYTRWELSSNGEIKMDESLIY